ncbi:MFS transporter [Micromonospora wenchangensis]|uniref:MFS transporter n=1 Tax=Micromonospora wenchangensis TaxID=1185415 RepID=UPI00382CFB6F
MKRSELPVRASGVGPDRTGPPAVGRRGRALLLVLSGNMLLDAVEVSVVLIALPTVAAEFGVSLPAVQWLMTGFALGFAALLVLGSRLHVRFGRRRTYLAAMLVFAVASMVGGLAGGLTVLVVTRLVKGACAALTAPAGLSIIAGVYPDGPRARRAVAVYAWFGAAGFTVGTLLAGTLLEAHWRLVFLAPAPVAVVLVVLAARLLPADGANRGWAPPGPGTPGPAAVRQSWLTGSFLRVTTAAGLLNGTYQSLLVLVVVESQQDYGWRPWQTAVSLLPACLPLALTAPVSGRFIARTGTSAPIAAGALAALLGYLYYLWRPVGDSYPAAVLPALLMVGFAFVLSFAALNLRATSTVAPAARAVPLYQTGVQVGTVVLLPLVCVLATGPGDVAARWLIVVAAAVGMAVTLVDLVWWGWGAAGRPGRPTRR